ncbi:hypothetical protein MKW98_027065, partial [Papaver atlanticum]
TLLFSFSSADLSFKPLQSDKSNRSTKEEMAEAKSGMRKAVFTKVDQLRPGTSGHTLTVKVVDAKMVLQKGGPPMRQMRIAECLVGDETGLIIFTARNDQVDLMKDGSTVILRNAKIDMFKGSMRLAVDKWGRVENKPFCNVGIQINALTCFVWIHGASKLCGRFTATTKHGHRKMIEFLSAMQRDNKKIRYCNGFS